MCKLPIPVLYFLALCTRYGTGFGHFRVNFSIYHYCNAKCLFQTTVHIKRPSSLTVTFMASLYHILLLALPRRAASIPLGGTIDSSSDAWAGSLSDVGPLVLLIGERSTKQLLRNVRGFATAFSLAAAPLGLVSIVSGLLRLAGSHRLRSFLGYELESRSVAAMELTRVNCNGVHAELVDGYLVRSTATRSASRGGVVGVSMLTGSLGEYLHEVVAQIHSCRAFENEKARLGIPESDAKLRWCLQATIRSYEDGLLQNLIVALTAISGVGPSGDALNGIMEYWKGRLRSGMQNIDKSDHTSKIPLITQEDSNEKHTFASRAHNGLAPNGKVSFLFTFDAISEFCTATVIPTTTSVVIGATSFLIIVALYIVELCFHHHWQPSTGYLLAVIGYAGIVASVIAAALCIQSTTQWLPLRTRTSTKSSAWNDGLVMREQSDSKSGAAMLQTIPKQPQVFQAIWLKPPTRCSCILANTIGLCLTLSFLCHYLGLRSSAWWFGPCELFICIVAAFFRSQSKSGPQKFVNATEQQAGLQPLLDWRCCSTGVVVVHEPQRLLIPQTNPIASGLDFRAYSTAAAIGLPTPAEYLAWRLAGLCIANKKVTTWLKEITGMHVWISADGQSQHQRALLVCYSGGVLVKEGLASPNTCVSVAFCSEVNALAAPTGLLARGIMRQPYWTLEERVLAETIATLGNVHIPALDPLLTWWTVSDQRNGVNDNQENLQWAFLLLLSSFFVFLRTRFSDDREMIEKLGAVLERNVKDTEDLASKVYECWKREGTAGEVV
jgi:hypothetical protein